MKRTIGIAALAAVMLFAAPSAWALGFGVDVGVVKPGESEAGAHRGLFGRLGLIGPLDLQLDLAKTTYADQERDDTRFGAGLRLEPLHLGHFIPALMASIGVIDVDTPAWQGQLGFRELGLGLVYEITRHVRLELDVRQGDQDVLAEANERGAEPLAGTTGTYRSGSLGLSVEF